MSEIVKRTEETIKDYDKFNCDSPYNILEEDIRTMATLIEAEINPLIEQKLKSLRKANMELANDLMKLHEKIENSKKIINKCKEMHGGFKVGCVCYVCELIKELEKE